MTGQAGVMVESPFENPYDQDTLRYACILLRLEDRRPIMDGGFPYGLFLCSYPVYLPLLTRTLFHYTH